jgi:dihydroflavonol-4-reductase
VSLRVAVTGSRGFIGRHVMEAIARRGDTAIPVARPFTPQSLAPIFSATDVVVHLAGVISAVRDEDFRAGNVDATRIVAQAAADAGPRLVHISSLAAAGPAPASAPRSEPDEAAPITTYGRTKLEGERAIQAVNRLRWTILRPGVVYGPGDRALRPLFQFARLGVLPLVGEPTAAFTFIYVDDAVRAIMAAVDRAPDCETIFLGRWPPVGARELLEAVRTASGARARIVEVPRIVTRLAAAAGDAAGALAGRPAVVNSRRYIEFYSPGFVCRVDRMAARLGVTAEVSLADGLARTARSYESERRG